MKAKITRILFFILGISTVVASTWWFDQGWTITTWGLGCVLLYFAIEPPRWTRKERYRRR